MKRHLTHTTYCFRLWLFWIAFFELGRLAFLLYNRQELAGLPPGTVLKTLLYGLRMDASMAAYLVAPVCLLLLLSAIYRPLGSFRVIHSVNIVLLLPVLLIMFADMPAYAAWGFRMDVSPLRYLSSPSEAWASVSHLPVFWIFALYGLVYWVTARKLGSMTRRLLGEQPIDKSKWAGAGILLLFMGALVLPLRGGWQLAPLNQSSVYFSDKAFPNHAAINPAWNFLHSLSHQAADKVNPFVFMPQSEADSLSSALLHVKDNLPASISEKRPNIILIIWESLTQKAVGQSWNGVEITPGFNQLAREGLYFDNAYASGDRTDKGVVAVLSGYPSQPTTSIVKIPRKANSLPTISSQLRKLGYQTAFSYGGELEFANMKAYLVGSGFDRYLSKEDFSSKDQNSKWGAHDDVVKDSLQRVISQLRQPFFSTWLTLSSHEPYETPVPAAIRGSKDVDQFLNSLHYSDSCVYAFVRHCQRQSWWNNTLLAIVADHGHRLPYTGKRIDDFRIPILLLDGRNKNRIDTLSHTVSQLDLVKTLLDEAGIRSDLFKWSRGLLADPQNGFAYFSFNNGFGLVNNRGYFIHDNAGKKITERAGEITEKDVRNGKAFLQASFQDYLDR